MVPGGREMFPHVSLPLLFLSQALYSFLAQPNALVHLDLSGTDCTVDMVRGWWREPDRKV